MVEGHGLSDVDDDDPPVPPEQVVLAHVRMDEFGFPDRLQVRHDVRVDRGGVLQPDLAKGGRRLSLVADVLHHEDVVVDPLRSRHANARVLHPDEVLVLLLRPRPEGGTDRALHLLEPRIPVDIHGDVAEGRVRDAVDLHGLRAAVGAGGVEDVRFLPRAQGIVQRRDDPIRDEVGDRQEGCVVEDLAVGLAALGIFLIRPERVVLDLPDLHDEEVAFANPHPLLQLPWDATEAAFPVLAHHANPRGAQKLVRDPEDLPVFPPGHSDADNLLLFSLSRDQGEGGLKRFRLRHSRRVKTLGSIVGFSTRLSPTGSYGNGRGGVSKNVGLTMSTPSGSSYFLSSTWPNQYTTAPSPNMSLYG